MQLEQVGSNHRYGPVHVRNGSISPQIRQQDAIGVFFPDNPYLAGVTYFDRATNTTRLLTDLLAANSSFTAPTTTAGGVAWAPGAGAATASWVSVTKVLPSDCPRTGEEAQRDGAAWSGARSGDGHGSGGCRSASSGSERPPPWQQR